MSYVLRGRTVAYDNIAVGSVAGRERVCPNLGVGTLTSPSGSAPTTELIGGGYGTGSTDSVGYSNIAVGSTYHTSPASGGGGIQDRTRNAAGNTTPSLGVVEDVNSTS